MSKDYYNILGVDRNATDDQIKKAYRKKAMELHLNSDNSELRLIKQDKKRLED